MEKLGIEVHTMGDGFTWDTKNPEQDIKTARETWALCVEKLRSGDYDLLVFDELVYVLSYKMLPVGEVGRVSRDSRHATALHIVVTGRDAPPELLEADLVTEMTEIKHPFTAGIRAQQGIEFLNLCATLPCHSWLGSARKVNAQEAVPPEERVVKTENVFVKCGGW